MATTAIVISINSTSLKVTLFRFFLLSLTLRWTKSASFLSEEDNPPSAVAAPSPESRPVLSFFMHDILGGSAPSGRVVAGLTVNTQISNLPFSKPNGRVFPPVGGIPLVNTNPRGSNNFNGILNNGNNDVFVKGKGFPFVTAGRLPAGSTLQSLLFGTITVIDDEITEEHEIGASVIGKAQGFHLASSMDGSSQTMAFTVTLDGEGGDHEDTISFFGVHRTASTEKSLIAIVGGTGKYEDARGYTTVETIHLPDQRTTDGVETLRQFNIYLKQ